MKNLTLSVIALCASLTAGSVFAYSCPMDMKAIDDAILTSTLSAAEIEKVNMLRVKGEQLHMDGDHDGSVKVLGEAKAMLGI